MPPREIDIDVDVLAPRIRRGAFRRGRDMRMRQLRIAVAQTAAKVRELLLALEAMDEERERPAPEFRRVEEFTPEVDVWLEVDKATAAAARTLRRLRALQAMKPRRDRDDDLCESPIDDELPNT